MSKESKQKNERMVFYATIGGKRIFPMILAPSKDGMVLSHGFKDIEDIHLTVMGKEDRISWHVKDKKKYGSKPPRFGGYEPEKIEKFMEKRLKRWLRYYHGNRKAWQMTDDQRKKLHNYMPKVADDGVIEYPLELRSLEFLLDFNNRKRWKHVKIRKLIGESPTFAVIIDEGKCKWVEPISENEMYCFTDEQYKRFLNDLFKHFGIDDYIDYLNNRVGDKVKSEIDRRLVNLKKSRNK